MNKNKYLNILMKFKNQLFDSKISLLLFFMLIFTLSYIQLDKYANYKRDDALLSVATIDKKPFVESNTCKQGQTLSFVIPARGYEVLSGLYLPTVNTSIKSDIHYSVEILDANTSEAIVSEYKTTISGFKKNENFNINLPYHLKNINKRALRVNLTLNKIEKPIKFDEVSSGLLVHGFFSRYSAYIKLIKMVLIIFSILLATTFYCVYYKKVKLHLLYLVNAAIIGIMISLIVPVSFVPDEGGHYATAYHYSNQIIGIKDDMANVKIRSCDSLDNNLITANDGSINFVTVVNNISKLTHNVFVSKSDTKIVKSNVSALHVTLYKYTYLFSTIGITIGRLIGVNGTILGYLGRFSNFLFYLLITTYAIYKAPKYKHALMFVGLLPMSLQMGASLSYDSFMISMTLLLTAYMIKLNEQTLNRNEKIILVISSLLLALAKQYAYSFIALLPFVNILIRKYKKNQKVKDLVNKGFLIGIPFAILGYSALLFIGNRFTFGSLLYIVSHPIDLIKFISTTLYQNGWIIMSSIFGNYFARFNIEVNTLVVLAYFIMLYLYIFNVEGKKNPFNKTFRWICILFSLITIFGISYGLMSWTLSVFPHFAKDYFVSGLQGRYFIPIIPIIIIALSRCEMDVGSIYNKTIIYASYFLAALTVISLLTVYAQLVV